MPTDDRPAQPSAEDNFAVNLRVLLEHKGMAQEALAKEMSDRGHKWHQSTVYKVLNGTRKVALGEATAVASILGMPVEKLAEGTEDIVEMSKIKTAMDQLAELRARLEHNVDAYESARYKVSRSLEDEDGAFPTTAPGVLRLFSPEELEEMRHLAYDAAEDVVRGRLPF